MGRIFLFPRTPIYPVPSSGEFLRTSWRYRRPFGISPIFPILAVVAAILRYRSYLVAAAVVALLSMLPTQIYGHRVLFLLPITSVGLVGDGYQEMSVRWSGPAGARLRQTCLGLAMAWAVALSLIGRSANAWSQREERDPERLITAGGSHAGPCAAASLPWDRGALLWRAGSWVGRCSGSTAHSPAAEWRTLLGIVDSAILGPQVLPIRSTSCGCRPRAFRRTPGRATTDQTRASWGITLGTYLVYSRRPTTMRGRGNPPSGAPCIYQ